MRPKKEKSAGGGRKRILVEGCPRRKEHLSGEGGAVWMSVVGGWALRAKEPGTEEITNDVPQSRGTELGFPSRARRKGSGGV